MSHLIQCAGFARAGKDTVAGFLVQDFGFVQRSYAAKLKALARSLTVPQRIEIDGKTEYTELPYWNGADETKRHPCVQLGKNARDILYPTIWIDALLKDPAIEDQIETSGVVISDCRYINEHEAGAALAARLGVPYLLLWIENPDVRPQGEEAEKTLPLRALADVILRNGSGITLDELRKQASNAITRLQPRRIAA